MSKRTTPITRNLAYYYRPSSDPSSDPKAALLKLIASAKHSLFFAIYSLTDKDIAAAIIAAKAKGVEVLGVADAGEWKGATSQFPASLAAGVNIRGWGANYRLMHEKSCVVDSKAISVGSFNWTSQAERENVEVMLVVENVKLAGLMEAQIDSIYLAGSVPVSK